MTDKCWLSWCDEPVVLALRDAAVKLCRVHADAVVARYAHTIRAEEELRRLKIKRAETEREARRQGNEGGDPVVYYALIGDYVKIGYTRKLRNRLATLRADRLLAVEPGGADLERQRHADFALERIDLRRENFRRSCRLDDHIEVCRQRHGLPPWSALPRTSEISRSAANTEETP